eukprot:TRINITY_DN23841_c0_g1_i1.p1 TRINITY_DN23841_c0_g1~~TRINITY_DN23841_c0_g1_i1.p1  ORF type:complete len:375 (+),score=69.37 TRINITY_DN23841_c0_g1_i1:102-1226(+)
MTCTLCSADAVAAQQDDIVVLQDRLALARTHLAAEKWYHAGDNEPAEDSECEDAIVLSPSLAKDTTDSQDICTTPSTPTRAISGTTGSTTPPASASNASSASRPSANIDDIEVTQSQREDAALLAKAAEMRRHFDHGAALGHLSDFAKEYCTTAFCCRLLRKYDGNSEQASAKLKKALLWREANQQVLTTRKFKETSDLRIVGKDTVGRPILYSCTKNQMLPNSEGLDQYIVRMVQAQEMMPQGVHTMTHIIDLHGISISLNLSLRAVMSLAEVLEGYFAETMHESIIIDEGLPRVLVFIRTAVLRALPARTRAKLKFLSVEETKAHLEANCDRETAERIGAILTQNRQPGGSIEARRKTWTHLCETGELVPVA